MNSHEYIAEINKVYQTGNATEYSYRAALEGFVNSFSDKIIATNEPKRQQCGAPDYIITTKKDNIPIGYIEAKDVHISMDKTQSSEQIKRYLKELDNFILTDYREFRFFRDGEHTHTIQLATLGNGQISIIPESIAELENSLTNFVAYIGRSISSSKQLATMMANKAKLMKDVFYKALTIEGDESTLQEQFNAFKKILMHDLDHAGFADIYAQTITYGLFTARLHDETLETFSRQEALELLPKTNPFLKRLFSYICGVELDERVKWIIDDLCNVYRHTDIKGKILKDFGNQTGRNDPIIHFYETFLSEYNPKLRKSRGVWYTPEAVVHFIVKAIDEVLKTHFNLPQGIADTSKIKVKDSVPDSKLKSGRREFEREVHKVQMLDVATGTGTFLAEVIKQIHHKFKNQQGMWQNYVDEHLLPRLHGFELLMASYAMCHMKLDLLLKETGYETKNANHRLSVYLTNSLEEAHPDADTLFASWLSKEANEASSIKQKSPVMVAFGNPPYSGESNNKGDFIMNLMEAYKKEPSGGKLQERNPKWINDDYVKFIRFGEHFIKRNNEGVLAYITNHGYLDNPTFRGMRYHLLETFDEIYIIDLHGNSKKKEICPDGSKDVNVFDIQAGVAIIIGVKNNKRKEKLAQVHHIDFWGKRSDKYDKLWNESPLNLDYTQLQNKAPAYFFVPKDYELEGEYEKGFKIIDIMPINSAGIVTAKDKILVAENSQTLEKQVTEFYEEYNEKYAQDYSYRPFDTRRLYFDNKKLERGRYSKSKHHLNLKNCSIVFARQCTSDWRYVMVSKNLTDLNLTGTAGRYGSGYFAPPLLIPR